MTRAGQGSIAHVKIYAPRDEVRLFRTTSENLHCSPIPLGGNRNSFPDGDEKVAIDVLDRLSVFAM